MTLGTLVTRGVECTRFSEFMRLVKVHSIVPPIACIRQLSSKAAHEEIVHILCLHIILPLGHCIGSSKSSRLDWKHNQDMKV